MIKVYVNGRGYDLAHGREISYRAAVQLAGMNSERDDYTVTFRFHQGRAGTLQTASDPIRAANKLVINVSDTSGA
jgi:hypothetical protein